MSPKLLSLELYVEECKHEDNAQVMTPISRGIECRAKDVLPQYAQVRQRSSASISEGVVCNCFRGETVRRFQNLYPLAYQRDKDIIGMKSSRFVYEMTLESPKGAICKTPLVPD